MFTFAYGQGLIVKRPFFYDSPIRGVKLTLGKVSKKKFLTFRLPLGAVLEIFAIFKKWLPSFKSNTLFYIHKAGCYAVISHSPTHPHISLNWNDPS